MSAWSLQPTAPLPPPVYPAAGVGVGSAVGLLVAAAVGLVAWRRRPRRPAGPDPALYRPAFEAGPRPAWVIDDATLTVLEVNAAAVRRFGYTPEEFRGRTLRDLCPPADADRVAAARTNGAPVRWKHRTKAGVLVETEATVHRLEVGGKPARLLAGAEAPEHRKAEAALREQEELLRSVIAHIPVGVFWKDRASIYMGCNDPVAHGFGMSVPGEVVGRTDYELAADPDEAEAGRRADRQVMDSGAPLLNIETTQTRPDGAKTALLVSKVPLRNPAGAVVGVLGLSQDVTERKRLEEQLRQAQKMEAIGRLAGGVAHDFNNLLTVIIGNAHLLTQPPAAGHEPDLLVEEIRDAATRAAALTRQLLTFSRRQPARPEPVDLNGVVEGLAGLLRRLLGERVAVRTALAPHPVVVRADKGQLEQVVMNLAVNARDAMPGGGTLTISTASTSRAGADGPGRIARLAVTDTGVGMTDEVKARIFEPFFTTKGVGKGTGLGLATVYGIVEQSGGTIEVESAPGAGTTFRIGLPWSEAAPSAVIAADEGRVLPHHATSATAGRTVLLVEDEDGLRRLARYTLEGQGYRVLDAEDGETALGLLTPGQPIDLLVTDMVMPGMDGRELAGRVTAAHPGVAVVLMSGYVPDCDRLDGVPGSVFVGKPYTPVDLARAAEKALRRAKAAAESLATTDTAAP